MRLMPHFFILGRDYFIFMFSNDGKVTPMGIVTEPGWSYTYGHEHNWIIKKTCNPGETPVAGMQGSGCAQRILQDGWQMKY